MHPAFLKRVVLPAWQHLRHQNSLRLLPHLEQSQWLSPDELADHQWQRIKEVLMHAYAHVPYYRDSMHNVGVEPADLVRDRSLQALPLLDRSAIAENLQRFRAANLPADRFVPNGTGGSTGQPLRFFDDRLESGWSDAAIWRSQRWYGVDVGDRAAYFWGANFDLSKFQGLSGRLRARALNLLMLPAWKLSVETAERFWEELADFRPRLLVGYAGATHQWAKLLGNDRPGIRDLSAIIVSAETLYDDWRSVIESCFKVPVYNRYGGRDIHFVAQECPRRNGLHINSETVFVEVVKEGRSANFGEVGEIVITRLDNYAMPFIRYRSGDLGVITDRRCDCGRSLPLLEKIEGRLQDAIVTADGRIVSGLLFAHMMKDCPEVKAFQIHQLTVIRLLVMVVLDGGRPFSSRERIERIIHEYMGDGMEVRFEICDDIPHTRSGKRRITVSHIEAYRPEASPSVVAH
jgi:phenylacetate-CoA ligase